METAILGPIEEALTRSGVEVVKTLKINGENAQVSYSSELGAWTICSKNVGLLC